MNAPLASGAPPNCLSDHPDFADIVRAAAEYHRIIPSLVLKDYWVTRVLRAIAGDPELRGQVLFKGGTSLSKGWGLIDRFSEDVDLLLTGDGFGPVPTEPRAREKRMKRLRSRIEADTPLRLPDQKSLSRKEWIFFYGRFDYNITIRYPLPSRATAAGLTSSDWVLVEAGFRGGPQPHENRPIGSLIAEFLVNEPGAAGVIKDYSQDSTSFGMDALKPERTLAEKLLLLHERMSRGVEGARKVPTRHYYDTAMLWERSPEVRRCVESGAIAELVREAAVISNTYFGAGIEVTRLDLRSSRALDPDPEQVAVLRARYDDPLERALYYRERPLFDRLLQMIAELRQALSGPLGG